MTSLILGIAMTLPLAVFIVSCDNELVPYKNSPPVPVIYGVLDPSDSIFYVKLERTFSGDSDAMVLASDESKRYFVSVSARLDYLNNNNEVASINLVPMDLSEKQDGIFTSGRNLIYCGHKNDFTNNGDPDFLVKGQFELSLYIEDINQQIRCVTEIPSKPVFVEPKPGIPTKIFFSNETPYRIIFYRQSYYYYEVVILFKYFENLIDGSSEQKQIEFRTMYPPYNSPFPFNERWVEQHLTPQVFLNRIARQINTNEKVDSRRFSSIDFIIRKGNPDYYNYFHSVNADLSTEVRPQSNISNGMGVFTCFASTVSSGHTLNSAALYVLCNDSTTRHLKFVYP